MARTRKQAAEPVAKIGPDQAFNKGRWQDMLIERGILKELSAPALRVKDALLYHADSRNGSWKNGIERLMAETGLSRRRVQIGLRDLEAAGVLRTRHGRGWATHTLTMPPATLFDQPPEGRRNQRGGGAENSAQGRRKQRPGAPKSAPHNPTTKPHPITPSNNPTTRTQADADELARIDGHLDRIGWRSQTPRIERRRLVRADVDHTLACWADYQQRLRRGGQIRSRARLFDAIFTGTIQGASA